MQVNLKHCLDLILDTEGGYSNRSDDPGGATNMGITWKTLSAWRKHPCTPADVQALERPEAEAIMAQEYAAKVAFDKLPGGLDYVVLDTAVNSGPARAARLLQHLVGTAEDGIIGAQTLAAVARAKPQALLDGYSQARLTYLKALTTWSTFGDGWGSRVARVEHDATTLATGTPPLQARPELLAFADVKGQGSVKLLSTPSGRSAVATLGLVLVSAGGIATQATGALQPYAEVGAVRYVLVVLAIVSAASTAWTTYVRTDKGATA